MQNVAWQRRRPSGSTPGSRSARRRSSCWRRCPRESGRLVIDLGRTRHVDSAGLGALMLIQRRAAERRQAVVLRNVSDEIRFLLVLTKLDDLFQLSRLREWTNVPSASRR